MAFTALDPLHQVMGKQYMSIIEAAWAEHARLLAEAKGIQRQSVELLRDLKQGKVTLDRVFVSDDGWEIMPEPPKPEAKSPNGLPVKETVKA